jgi:hypothetical protein
MLCRSLWGRKCSKFLSKILKFLSWERFGEDICNLFFCPNVLQLDILFNNLFPLKVKLNWNMFGLGMHHWTLGDTYNTSYCHKLLRWAHHILLVCLAEFASSRGPEYNMLLLQYIFLMLWTMILRTYSYLTRTPDNHPSRRLLH